MTPTQRLTTLALGMFAVGLITAAERDEMLAQAAETESP